LIFAGTRRGANPMQVRGKSGRIKVPGREYLWLSYRVSIRYLRHSYGRDAEVHASKGCVFAEKSLRRGFDVRKMSLFLRGLPYFFENAIQIVAA